MPNDVSVPIGGEAMFLLTLVLLAAIVEKHVRFAFYHASAEAFASMLTDMPYKVRPTLIIATALLMVRTDPELYLLQYHTVFYDSSPTDTWRVFLLLPDFVSVTSGAFASLWCRPSF